MKKMKKVMTLLLSIVLVVGVFPGSVMAKERVSNSSCSINPEIRIKEIVNAEVVDGDLYIDVIEEPTIQIDMAYGPCPSPYKYTTRKVSRKELVDLYRSEMDNNTKASRVMSILTMALGPAQGAVLSNLNYGNEQVLSEVFNAIATTKTSFTAKTKLKCIQGDMGSRGIVHRYKLESISIK